VSKDLSEELAADMHQRILFGEPAMSVTLDCGVGIDTARYGHHATFLRDDLQPAAPPLAFAETAADYEQLRRRFQQIAERYPGVHFRVHLDVAGQYSSNLQNFLRGLGVPMTLSIGEPTRNKRYRETFYPKRKADPVDSQAAARFAVRERPAASPDITDNIYALREVVARLEGQTKQSTRLTNQLHNLLARVFPELALLAKDLQAAWVLTLLERYPTPAQLAGAEQAALLAIPYVTEAKAASVQQAARSTVASFRGPAAETLVRNLVKQLRASQAAENSLRELMVELYAAEPANLIHTIPGIGDATAAVLTAKIGDIGRFKEPEKLVGYFGTFSEEESSGMDKDGQPKRHLKQVMSRKGNDLVRKYLWNAAKSAIQHNPAVRAMYKRLRARGVRGDVALGHAMRKLLHLVFAVWKTGRPFDENHYPWEKEETAGHKQGTSPERKVVTAATVTVTPAETEIKPAAPPAPSGSSSTAPAAAGSVDFAGLREQVSMGQVLGHLGILDNMRGRGSQRRGPCPIHRATNPRSRTFSVDLDKNIWQCFHASCGAHGNVLDFWAALQRQPLPDAARELASLFLPPTRTREEEPVRKSTRSRGQKTGVITPDAP
jgi:transposase